MVCKDLDKVRKKYASTDESNSMAQCLDSFDANFTGKFDNRNNEHSN